MLDMTIMVNGEEVAALTASNDKTGTNESANYAIAYWQHRPDGEEDMGEIRFTNWDNSRPALEFVREIIDQIIVERAERIAARDAD